MFKYFRCLKIMNRNEGFKERYTNMDTSGNLLDLYIKLSSFQLKTRKREKAVRLIVLINFITE